MKNNCETIQPNLLDYAQNRLTSDEAETVRVHLAQCPECTVLMQEELSIADRLATVPMVSAENDVWALVRARTRPAHTNPLERVRGMFTQTYRLAAVAAITVVMVASAYFISSDSGNNTTETDKNKTGMVVQWSDDPVGTHTNAVVSFIDDM